MHEIPLITTIALGLSAALLFGLIAKRLGLSPIVGYVIAGIVIGPYTPGVVGNAEIASELAEIGVILLMFGVGLHFHLKDLLAVRSLLDHYIEHIDTERRREVPVEDIPIE